MPMPLEAVDLRIDARWVIPVEPMQALCAHSVIVNAGRILAVLPTTDVAQRYHARETVTLNQHAVLPGLVNAHVHAAMTLFRGIAGDVTLRTWLEQHIWPRERQFVGPDFVYDGARLGAAEMLRAGITCCNDMYFFPDATGKAFVELGLRGMLGLPVLDFPTSYAADADAYLRTGLEIRDALKGERLLTFSLAPHAPYTVGNTTWERVVTYARQLDLPIQTHLAETQAEVDESRERFHVTPLARLHELGATGPSFIAIHAVHLTTEDIELLSFHGGHVVHCPASNMKLASGIAPVTRMIERGISVGLGTDGAASNDRLDILEEMRLASLLAKIGSGDAAAFPAPLALAAATLGGARALGMDRDIGSLVADKKADIIAINLARVETEPCYDPLSHLVNAAGREAVTDVWVDGARVLRDRELQTADLSGIVARARAWQERMQ